MRAIHPPTTTGPTTRDTADTEAAATDQYHPPKTMVPTTRDTGAAATDQYLYTHAPVVDTPPPTCGIISNIACVSLYPALIFNIKFLCSSLTPKLFVAFFETSFIVDLFLLVRSI
jgi:hypothetical protein